MSTPFLSPRPHKPQELDWARLIPGETPAFRSGRKKPVRPARTFAPEEAPEMWEESASAGAYSPPPSRLESIRGTRMSPLMDSGRRERLPHQMQGITTVDLFAH